MINAWSLLWEEINGTMDETYPIKEDVMTGIRTDVVEGEKSKYWYDYDRNDPDRENPFDNIDFNFNFTKKLGRRVKEIQKDLLQNICMTLSNITRDTAPTVPNNTQ